MASILEFSFKIEDRPGALASVSELLGKAGINIDGLAAIRCEGKGLVHLLPSNTETAASALKAAGIKYETRQLIEVKLDNKPGELAKLTCALGDAKVNITTVYITMRGTLVLGFDNIEAATKVLHKLASS